MMRFLKSFVLAFLFVLFLVPLLHAQTAAPVVPDYTAMEVSLIVLLGGFAVTIATYFFKLLIPQIPAVAWPIVVTALGQLGAVVQSYIAGHTFSPLVGAAITAGASIIYALISTAQDNGVGPTKK